MPKFILPVKISCFFSAVSGVEMKNLQRTEQAYLLVLRLRRSISRLQLRGARSMLHREPACRLISLPLPALLGLPLLALSSPASRTPPAPLCPPHYRYIISREGKTCCHAYYYWMPGRMLKNRFALCLLHPRASLVALVTTVHL